MPEMHLTDHEIIADLVNTSDVLEAIRDTVRGVMDNGTKCVITQTERDAFIDRLAREIAQVVINMPTCRVIGRMSPTRVPSEDLCGNCNHRRGDHEPYRCKRFDGRREGCACTVFVEPASRGAPRGRYMSDVEIRDMVRGQIRSEFGAAVEFGSGTAGEYLEEMMIKRIHDNRRQFDQLIGLTNGIKTQ